MKPAIRLLPLLLTPVFLTGAGVSHVIDDLEPGPFSLAVIGFSPQTVTVPLGVLGRPDREVTLWGGDPLCNGWANAALTYRPGDNAVEFFGINPVLQLAYERPAQTMDLTGGGAFDHLYVSWEAGVVPGGASSPELRIVIRQGGSALTIPGLPPGPQGVTVLDLGALTPVFPLHAVTRLELTFSFASCPAAAYAYGVVSDVRLGRGPAAFTTYDALVSQVAWCPTCPRDVLRFDAAPCLPGFPGYEVGWTLLGASPSNGSEADLVVTAFDSGGDLGQRGNSAGSALWWNTGGEFPSTEFELEVGTSSPGGVEANLAVPPRITHVDSSSFGVEYVLRIDDGAAGTLGHSVESVLLRVPPGQGVEIRVPVVSLVAGSASAFRIRFTLEPADDVDAAVPLVSTLQIGDWTSDPLPTAAPLPGAGTRPGLVALPSVTRDGTELRMAGAAAFSRAVVVVDVAGRAIRRLDVPSGHTAVRWDGRDGTGRLAASGVYFAALEGDGRAGIARVVLVR